MSKDTAMVWNKRYPILDESHSHDLDARAAVHEFQNRMPRQAAEEQAHKDYMKQHAIAAAAHHLLGVRASHSSGHDEAAAKHGEAYAGAMTAAGLDPYGPPPEEITNHIKANKPEVYSFKAHPGDQLFTPQQREADEADASIQKLLQGLGDLRTRLKKSISGCCAGREDNASKHHECPHCQADVDKEGDALDQCSFSSEECEHCHSSPCDQSC